MINILAVIFILSGLIAAIFLLLAIFNFIKLDKIKAVKMLKFTGISIVIFILSFIAVGELSHNNAETPEKEKHEEKPVAKIETVDDGTWQDKVKEIAALNNTSTEKFDTIVAYAKKYPSTKAEIKEFENYIIAEYTNKEYLADIKDEAYLLGNIFKAYVINRYYGDEETPINDFVYGFYQNSNNVLRGIESSNSNTIKYNERQMDKALTAIENP